jgi:hypothetical protein
MQPHKEEPSVLFKGKTEKVTLPSGRVVTIRETNGADDEILSSSQEGDEIDGEGVIRFLASIIDHDETLTHKPLAADVAEYFISDKYYLLFYQRIMNLGHELHFEYSCQNPSCKYCKEKTRYQLEEDLRPFITDFSKPEGLTALQAKPYPLKSKNPIDFTLNSGKQVRYSVMDSNLEKAELDMPPGKRNKNTQLVIRRLQLLDNGKWINQLNFHAFSSREMNQIRNHIAKHDPLFHPIVYFDCPNCKQQYAVPILGMAAFFWPGEEM